MKKISHSLHAPNRRLRLERETLRILVDRELAEVQGGSQTTPIPTTASTGTKDTGSNTGPSRLACPGPSSGCPAP